MGPCTLALRDVQQPVRGSHSRSRHTIQRSYTRGVITLSPAIHTLGGLRAGGGVRAGWDREITD